MKILYIHQYFKTPDQPGGTRSYWISKELVSRGHEVVVVSGKNNLGAAVKRENIDGINVIYINSPYNNYLSPLAKVKTFITFLRSAIREAAKEKDVDIVYATSTPLTIGAVALRLKRLKGWKYVFEVRDLWPEFPIQIGAIKNKILIKILRLFEKRIYTKAEHIVALSPGMQDGVIATGIPKEKVSMIPNMSKPDEFFPRTPSAEIIKEFNIDMEKFNVIHFGSMGKANGLLYIVETAKILQEQNIEDVNFIFLGDGATLPILKEFVSTHSLHNVQFLGNHKMSVVSEIVNCCDLSMTSFLNIPILYTNSPNKLFDTLSAGKPIVVNSAGWTKTLVEDEDCGFYVNPDDPSDFAKRLNEIKGQKELLSRWGENARKLSLNTFDKKILSKQVADVLDMVNQKK